MYYIHPDQLGTPRAITNQAQQIVWRWDNEEPFGGSAPNDNPSGLGTFTFNLRFPGQYFDAETNNHYNYFRDYSPDIGRYIRSDPIGLRGGINMYSYVGDNPLSRIDPRGLVEASGDVAGLGDEILKRLLNKSLTDPQATAVGSQCGTNLCRRGAGPKGSPGRDADVLRECLAVISIVPIQRGTAATLQCQEICNKIVDECQKPKSSCVDPSASGGSTP
ncbi:MAG TPA: RHS repeat-associated core domain-containing protein [Burkholderiales bacterium]|nr:RHS repeat-associated core domain-containing protein [Burkholderiales bacterium]